MTVNKAILRKYFSRQCTPEEEKVVIEYLTNSQNNLDELQELLNEEQQAVVPETIPASLFQSVTEAIRNATWNGFLQPSRPMIKKWWYAAAAAVILPVLGWFLWWQPKPASETNAEQIAAIEKFDTIFNTTNATARAVMPDGTAIWLTANSHFSYQPHQYGVKKRYIRLEGEAFFDVFNDPMRPFIVEHDKIITQVLGTTFNIEAYPNEEQVKISLVSGKVAVNASTDTIRHFAPRILEPGQQLIYNKQASSMTIKPLIYKDAAVFTKGWLVLDDVSLADALDRLKRQTGLNIIVPDNIRLDGKSITAIFKGGDPKELLANMLFAHGLQFREKNGSCYLYKN